MGADYADPVPSGRAGSSVIAVLWGPCWRGQRRKPLRPFRATDLHSLVPSSAEGSGKQDKGEGRRYMVSEDRWALLHGSSVLLVRSSR